MRFLIVDNEPKILGKMKRMIQEIKPKSEIVCADSGKAALEAVKGTVDVAFLEILLPDMNGLELARRLKKSWPKVNIIFTTAHSQYAVEAFAVHASGYLKKPVAKEHIAEELENLRNPVFSSEAKLKVQCFGNFEVFYQGHPLQFGRAIAKELLAILINLRGESANTEQLCSLLWEDSVSAEKNRHYFRNIVAELKRVLRSCGAEDVFISRRNSFSIDVTKVDCDYYRFLNKEEAAVNTYQGEYMRQYSWAEMTAGELENETHTD